MGAAPRPFVPDDAPPDPDEAQFTADATQMTLFSEEMFVARRYSVGLVLMHIALFASLAYVFSSSPAPRWGIFGPARRSVGGGGGGRTLRQFCYLPNFMTNSRFENVI